MTIEEELLILESKRVSGELSETEYEAQKFKLMSSQPLEGASPPPFNPNQPPQTPYPGMTPYSPGYGVRPPVGYRQPPTYLALAIVSTLLCCLPLGIVGIVYASQVSTKWNMGDYSGAMRASKNAKTWSIVSIALGAIPIGFWILAIALGSMSSTSGY